MTTLDIRCNCGNVIKVQYDGPNPISGSTEEVQVKCQKCGAIHSFQKPSGAIHNVISGGYTV